MYDKNIFYINDNGQLCKMDTNGQNKKVILYDQILNYVIYKDKIYYTLIEQEPFQLNSMDLSGNKLNSIEIPTFYDQNGEEDKFYLDYIYNDYVYFQTGELAGSDLFRMKIDGTDKNNFGLFPYITGFAKDEMIVGYNTTQINAFNIYNIEQAKILYDKVDYHLRSGEVDYYQVTNNDNYIAHVYRLSGENFYNITILSTDGEILNEIKLESDIDYVPYFDLCIINDYLYLVYDYNDDENLSVRVNLFDGKFEYID